MTREYQKAMSWKWRIATGMKKRESRNAPSLCDPCFHKFIAWVNEGGMEYAVSHLPSSEELVKMIEEKRIRAEARKSNQDALLIISAIKSFLDNHIVNDDNFVFIPAMTLTRVVNTRSEWPISAKCLNAKIRDHIQSGKIQGVRRKRTNRAKGYEINRQQFACGILIDDCVLSGTDSDHARARHEHEHSEINVSKS
jgi:hypothetical protein